MKSRNSGCGCVGFDLNSGMALDADEPRMARATRSPPPVRRPGLCPKHQHPRPRDRRAIVVVHLVTMPVSFRDDIRTGTPACAFVPGTRRQSNAPSRIVPPICVIFRCSSSRHTTGCGVAGLNSVLLASSKADHVAGELDRRALQAEADAEERQPGFAGEADRVDLAVDAAFVEAAGHEQAVDARQRLSRRLPASSFSESIRTTRTFAWWCDAGVVERFVNATCKRRGA